ncbi:hypothetical protein [Candidatus Electrothrix sp.]|uniref:hypothetical protein n=1 Tax=Candidatus Electrothrix sp. TaxID=2170559 RepID=UPI004055B0FA
MKYYRPDITQALIHLTGDRTASNGCSAEQALQNILKEGKIRGSNSTGFIKGPNRATCFTEMPLSSVKYFIKDHYAQHKYENYGIAMHKSHAWNQGARPVIYLPDNEGGWIPDEEKWRLVRFEYGDVDFTHEREWRCKGDVNMAGGGIYIIVPDNAAENRLRSSEQHSSLSITSFLHMDYLNELM